MLPLTEVKSFMLTQGRKAEGATVALVRRCGRSLGKKGLVRRPVVWMLKAVHVIAVLRTPASRRRT